MATVRENIQEYTSNAGSTLKVDHEKGIIPACKILGRVSANNREYTPGSITNAIQLYESCAVFVDHGKKGEVRSYRDRLGQFKNVSEQADGLFGDFHFNPKHALAEQIAWDAENCPSNCGFSHDAEAHVSRKDGKQIVESILSVRSVDLVAKPATTAGLFESTDTKPTQETSNVEYKDITLASLTENRKDLVEQLTGTDATSKLNQEIKTLKESISASDAEKLALTEKVKVLEGEKAEQALTLAINDELKAAKLDTGSKIHVSEAFMGTLKSAKDSAARTALIADRVSLLKLATSTGGAPPFATAGVTEGTLLPGKDCSETIARLRG